MKINVVFLLLLGLLLLSACQITEAATIPQPTTEIRLSSATPLSRQTLPASATPTSSAVPTLTPSPEPASLSEKNVMLMAVGDIMLGRTIGDLITEKGAQIPFADTVDTLSSADITIGNLECPISSLGQPEEKTYAFRAPIAAGESLSFAGFDLVSLANNHSLDYGPLALAETLQTLTDNSIRAVGAGMNEDQAYAPVFIEIDGLRLAFLAFVDIAPTDYDYTQWEAGPNKPGVAWAHPHKIQAGVQAAKNQADVVIVLVHNGYEIVEQVSRYQQETARLAIDSGASLVIGSHPHVLQRIERYQDGLIAYSMGNFVFDNFLFPPNYSAILAVELSPNGVESFELIDVVIQLNGIPQIMPYNHNN